MRKVGAGIVAQPDPTGAQTQNVIVTPRQGPRPGGAGGNVILHAADMRVGMAVLCKDADAAVVVVFVGIGLPNALVEDHVGAGRALDAPAVKPLERPRVAPN